VKMEPPVSNLQEIISVCVHQNTLEHSARQKVIALFPSMLASYTVCMLVTQINPIIIIFVTVPEVDTETESNDNTALVAGVVGSVAAVAAVCVILLIAVVLCCCMKKYQSKYELRDEELELKAAGNTLDLKPTSKDN